MPRHTLEFIPYSSRFISIFHNVDGSRSRDRIQEGVTGAVSLSLAALTSLVYSCLATNSTSIDTFQVVALSASSCFVITCTCLCSLFNRPTEDIIRIYLRQNPSIEYEKFQKIVETIEPNSHENIKLLLEITIDCPQKGQIKHALRAFRRSFASISPLPHLYNYDFQDYPYRYDQKKNILKNLALTAAQELNLQFKNAENAEEEIACIDYIREARNRFIVNGIPKTDRLVKKSIRFHIKHQNSDRAWIIYDRFNESLQLSMDPAKFLENILAGLLKKQLQTIHAASTEEPLFKLPQAILGIITDYSLDPLEPIRTSANKDSNTNYCKQVFQWSLSLSPPHPEWATLARQYIETMAREGKTTEEASVSRFWNSAPWPLIGSHDSAIKLNKRCNYLDFDKSLSFLRSHSAIGGPIAE